MNICTFSGRLTRDAETRYATSGTAITSFSIAVDGGYGEHKRTDFINCKFFKRENLGQHLTKGKPVMVSGELQTEKWTDKDGNQRTGFSIICRDIDFQQGGNIGAATQDKVQSEYTGRQEYSTADMGDAPF